MSTFNTYQTPVPEAPIARKWFIVALIASLLIHACLFVFFSETKLEHFSPYTERLVPRAFTSLGRVEVDQKLLDPEPEKPAQQQTAAQQIASAAAALPEDKPSTEANPGEVVYKPTAPELVNPITNDKPKVDNANLQAMEKVQQKADLNDEMNSVSDQLIKDKTKINSNALLKLSEAAKNNGAGTDSGIPGTKSLDEAIAGTGGGLHSGDKIGIRGGALFEYDKADLRSDALPDLQKLALIVKHHPNATFTIEGYADSFGAADYNLALSQRRAEAVKAWLLVNIGVNPFKIEAKGLGSTNFVVAPSGTVEEQEKNRRVEIGIKFPQ